MVDFTTLMKGSFRKFQLQAEVALLDRDVTNRQRSFGVELYDLIEKQRIETRAQIDRTIRETEGGVAVAPESVESFLKIFRAIENEIREPLESCRKDVTEMEESRRPGFPPLFIQRRKETFGIEVWPIVSGPKWLHNESLGEDLKTALLLAQKTKENSGNKDGSEKVVVVNGSGGGEESSSSGVDIGGVVTGVLKSVVNGTKTTITKAIGKLSPKQRDVEACISVAKRDIAEHEKQKMEKMVEIEALVTGGTTLECC